MDECKEFYYVVVVSSSSSMYVCIIIILYVVVVVVAGVSSSWATKGKGHISLKFQPRAHRWGGKCRTKHFFKKSLA